MADTIKIKGFIAQYSWEDKAILRSDDPSTNEQHCIAHREIEIEVPVHSLKFNPEDAEARKSAFRDHELACLIAKKAKLEAEVQRTEEEIQKYLALPAASAADFF